MGNEVGTLLAAFRIAVISLKGSRNATGRIVQLWPLAERSKERQLSYLD
jgi:hypothetical protein